MFFADVLIAFIIALAVSVVFTVGLKRRGAWPSFFILLLLVFLVTWAGGVWITPFGPLLWGSYWLPFLFVGIIVSMLLTVFEGSASDTSVRLLTRKEKEEEQEQSRAEAAVLGTFFWVLIVLLGLVIVLRYLFI